MTAHEEMAAPGEGPQPPAADEQVTSGAEAQGRTGLTEARREAVEATAARGAAEARENRLRAMVAGLNAIVWERDPDSLRVRFINRRAEEVLGYPVAWWRDDPGLMERIVHPDDREDMLRNVRAGIAGEEDFSLCYRARAADGRWVWLQHLGHVARDDAGVPRALHGVLLDITAQHRREQAGRLQGAAGRALAGPGGVESRLATVCELLAAEFGEWVALWLASDDGRYRPVAAAPADVAERVLALGPVQAAPPLAAQIRARRAFVVPKVTAELRRAATADEQQYAALTALGGAGRLVVPLCAADEVVGLLTVTPGHAGSDAVSLGADADGLGLAADLGERVATMVATERLAARQRQLHELTVALAAAGSVAEAAAAVAEGLRDALGAAVVGVCRLDADGRLHLVHDVGYPPDRLVGFTAASLSAPFPFAEAARTGRPVWLPDRQAWEARYPEAATYLLAQTQAGVGLPLLVDGRVLGTIAASFPTPRRFDPAERAFLLTAAGQVAAALERAALADARREMADTLQRSLLPRVVPHPDGLAVAARYLPAVQGTSAGGDWYDVLPLPDGQIAVAVGDVVGHGAPAAAVMGQLRSSLATLLLAGFAPARALELLDRFAEHVAGARVSTVACLRLDPRTGWLTYSRAGHPPAMVVDQHGATLLDGGLGPALGLSEPGSRPEAQTTLPPGATLLAFTDGLIERPGTALDTGLDRLAAASAGQPAAPPDVLVDGLLTELVGGQGAGDDIVLVALHLRPQPLHLQLPAAPAQLHWLRRAVGSWATAAGLGHDATEDLQLALGEAVGNAVEHAYRDTAPGPVEVHLDLDEGEVTTAVSDGGTWHPAAADPGFRGRGLQMIGALAHDVEVDRGPGGTTLRFRLIPTSSTAAVPRQRQGPEAPGPRQPLPARLRAEHGDRTYLRLSGELDLAGVQAVRSALLAELADDPGPITLDFSALDFLTSVGIGLLLEAADGVVAHGNVDFVLPEGGAARRALDLTGLTRLLQRPPHRTTA